MGSYLNPLNKKLDADQALSRSYDADKNRLRVDAQVSAVIGAVDVVIDSESGDNIAIKDTNGNELLMNADGSVNANVKVDHIEDSIAIGDGVSKIASITTVSGKNAIDVNVVATPTQSNSVLYNQYEEVSSVPSSVEVDILTYTVPSGSLYKIVGIETSGENIATYSLTVNGTTIQKGRTYFGGSLNYEFKFKGTGLLLQAGDEIKIKVIHQRPYMSDFNANLQIIQEN